MFNIGNVSRICTFDCSSSNYLIAINGAYPMVSYYSDIGTVFQNTNVIIPLESTQKDIQFIYLRGLCCRNGMVVMLIIIKSVTIDSTE